MIIKSVRIEKKFIPEFNDNKSQPASEQMVIHFSRIPGTSEKANYKDFKFDSKGGIQLVYNDQQLAQSFISKIDNLEIEVDGVLTAIRNGIQLAEANASILAELFTEIRNHLFPDTDDIDSGELNV